MRRDYELAVNIVMAKDILRFNNLRGSGPEFKVGMALLYFLVVLD